MNDAAAPARAWPGLLAIFLLGAACAAACRIACGNPLGFAIGALGFLTLIAPPLAGALPSRMQRLVAAGLSIAPFVLVLTASLQMIGGLELIQVALVMIGYTLALIGLAHALMAARFSAAIASTVVIVLAIAWLTWPIWLAPHVHSADAFGLLVTPHPIMSINTVLRDFGIWTQQPLMYRLTTLGQDVPYALPRTIWPCVILHGVIGLLLALPARADDALSDR